MKQFTMSLPKFILLLMVFTVASIMITTVKAEAATLNVVAGTDAINNLNDQCQLSEAIQNINDQAITNDDCIAGDGNNDTINLPSGTITSTVGLTTLIRNVSISGAGSDLSFINATGTYGISFDNSLTDVTFQGFKIFGGFGGIGIANARDVNISNVEVENSATGIYITNSLHTTISNVYVHGGISNLGNTGGLNIHANAVNDSDIPFIHVYDSKVINNQTINQDSGLTTVIDSHTANSASIIIERTTISENRSQRAGSGLRIASETNDPLELTVSAVTVANNSVIPDEASLNPIPYDPAYVAGLSISVRNLSEGQNFTNVTMANNQAINTVDDHLTIAGFFGIFFNLGNKLSIINTTVVGNEVTQSIPGVFSPSPSFMLVGVTMGQFGPTDLASGGSAQNSLIVGNTYNESTQSCLSELDGSFLGLFTTYNIAPLNLGNNITDDIDCLGYNVVPNVINFLGPLQDNGGPVPTIALLPGSPAISAGGAVLGISTDARGIARPSTPDVGAYQTVLGSNTDNSSNPATNTSVTIAGVGVPNTGLGGDTRTQELWVVSIAVLMILASLSIELKKWKRYDKKYV